MSASTPRPPSTATARRAAMLASVALLAGFGPVAARAQETIELDTVTVEGDGTAAAGTGQGTGPGQANEQKGFVAVRSLGATKTNTPLIETPQSVSVVTQDQIQQQEVRTISAATRYTAGVTGETTGGGDTRFGGLFIRGFDSTANSTFFDGLRLPSTASINFFGIDPYGAERIEILKGPSSVLYGQSGPGGLVNYVSKRPTGAPLREVEILGGDFDRIEGRFDVSGPLREGSPWGFRLTGVARDAGSEVDTVDDDRLFIAPVLSYEPDADTSLTFSGIYQRDRAGWGLQFRPASGTVFDNNGRRMPRSRFLGEPDFDAYDTDLGTVGYRFEHRVDDVWTVRQNARYSAIGNDQRSFYGGGYLDEDAGLLNRFGGAADSDLQTFSIDNQAQAEFETGILGHTVLGGIDYRWTDYSDVFANASTGPLDVFNPVYGSPVTLDSPYTDRNVRQGQTGLYLQDQVKIDRLSVLLSGRQDFADTRSFEAIGDSRAEKGISAFTGRVGAIYNFDNGFAPFATYSESFLPPLDTDVDGNLFEAEEGRQYEAGVKYQPPGWNAYATATVFDIVRDNAIRFDAVGGTFAARQTGQITSRGFELEGVASLTDNLNMRLAYTYLDVEVTEDPDGGFAGTTPVTVPEHSISAWADYTIRNGSMFDGLGAGLGVRYVGSSFGDDANTFKVPGATVFDAALSYERDNYKLSVNASNLFDKDYVASCGNRDFFCFYGEGRRVTGKASIRW